MKYWPLLILLVVGTARAQVSCIVTITHPVEGARIHGVGTVNITDQCTGGSPGFNRLYVGNLILNSYDPGNTLHAIQLDTTKLPNGPATLEAQALDSTGLIVEGSSAHH